MARVAIVFILCFYVSIGYTQKKNSPFQIAFYNLENLFDTINDIGKEDIEYTPKGVKNWESEKYWHKINHLARAIASFNHWKGPELLGVCEVEHRHCLEDLVQQSSLEQFNYGIIHKESKDKRGIDVACIYKKNRFQVLDYQYIPVQLQKNNRPTRDILYVMGSIDGQDTIHVFFNHWPSRYLGAGASEPKRMIAAEVLKGKVDSISKLNLQAKIIISGDFNDDPIDKSISEILEAKNKLIDTTSFFLFNTSDSIYHQKELGTHKFRDHWSVFDQMIISSTLFKKSDSEGFFYQNFSSAVHHKKWLLTYDDQFTGNKPFRTFYGNEYLGGYSDHFGVSILLEYYPQQ